MSSGLGATVGWLALGRLPATTAVRMLAPLLGVVAAGVGVSLVTAGALVAVLEVVGFTAPAAGWLVDRFGTRRTLLVGQAAFVVGALTAALAGGVATFAVGLVVIGLAATLYEAAMTAWVAGASDYAQRARWLGRLDLAWAGGLLVGVPVVALLSTASWRLAYVAIAALATVSWWPLHRRVVEHHPVAGRVPARWRWSAVRRGWWVFAAFGLLSGASQLVIVVYGVWLGDRFGTSTAVIGAVGFLLGSGDLAATLATLRWTDALGKVLAATLGAAVLAGAAATLVLTHHHAVAGVLTILVLLLGYEFALLATKPVLTEVDPDNRGMGIGIGFGAAAACRGLGAVVGTALYSRSGLPLVATAAAATGAGALLVLLVGGRGQRRPTLRRHRSVSRPPRPAARR